MKLRLSDVSFNVAPKEELKKLSLPMGGMRHAIAYPESYRGARVILARTLFTGDLIGWCLYRPIQEPTRSGISNDVMFWFYVRPEHRRKGIGRMLAARARLRARKWFRKADRFAVSEHTGDIGRAFFRSVVPDFISLAVS